MSSTANWQHNARIASKTLPIPSATEPRPANWQHNARIASKTLPIPRAATGGGQLTIATPAAAISSRAAAEESGATPAQWATSTDVSNPAAAASSAVARTQ